MSYVSRKKSYIRDYVVAPFFNNFPLSLPLCPVDYDSTPLFDTNVRSTAYGVNKEYKANFAYLKAEVCQSQGTLETRIWPFSFGRSFTHIWRAYFFYFRRSGVI